MSLDMPASAQALWAIYDATGIRPEALLVVLANESSLNPTAANGQGAPYIGIGQNNTDFVYQQTKMDQTTYLQQSASFQLSQVVLPYFKGVVAQYGKLDSGVRVYQAEFYPASLRYATGLQDVIVRAPDPAYEANKGFDKAGKGYITPQDLADVIAVQAAKPAVKSAIAAVYAQRPWMFPEDPVYGSTFLSSAAKFVGIVVVSGAAAVIAMELFGAPKWAPRSIRKAFA